MSFTFLESTLFTTFYHYFKNVTAVILYVTFQTFSDIEYVKLMFSHNISPNIQF